MGEFAVNVRLMQAVFLKKRAEDDWCVRCMKNWDRQLKENTQKAHGESARRKQNKTGQTRPDKLIHELTTCVCV